MIEKKDLNSEENLAIEHMLHSCRSIAQSSFPNDFSTDEFRTSLIESETIELFYKDIEQKLREYGESYYLLIILCFRIIRSIYKSIALWITPRNQELTKSQTGNDILHPLNLLLIIFLMASTYSREGGRIDQDSTLIPILSLFNIILEYYGGLGSKEYRGALTREGIKNFKELSPIKFKEFIETICIILNAYFNPVENLGQNINGHVEFTPDFFN